MAIARKPDRNTNAIDSQDVEQQAEKFILGADPAPPAATRPPARKRMDPIMLRMDDATVSAIDRRAAKLGLSRSAWVRMVISKALDGED